MDSESRERALSLERRESPKQEARPTVAADEVGGGEVAEEAVANEMDSLSDSFLGQGAEVAAAAAPSQASGTQSAKSPQHSKEVDSSSNEKSNADQKMRRVADLIADEMMDGLLDEALVLAVRCRSLSPPPHGSPAPTFAPAALAGASTSVSGRPVSPCPLSPVAPTSPYARNNNNSGSPGVAALLQPPKSPQADTSPLSPEHGSVRALASHPQPGSLSPSSLSPQAMRRFTSEPAVQSPASPPVATTPSKTASPAPSLARSDVASAPLDVAAQATKVGKQT